MRGRFDRLCDRWRCDPLAERIVVVRLDDRSCVTVDDGADTAEVVAEIVLNLIGQRTISGVLTYYPAGGGQGAVKGYNRRV